MARTRLQLTFWLVAAIGGFYAVFLALIMNPWIQRHALYAHKLNTAWFEDIEKFEKYGFAENQISPFRIMTPDNETLYAWHILPMGLYAEHATRLTADIGGAKTKILDEKVAMQLLRDPDSRLVIYYHGNAGHVAQGWRTDAYKSLSACDSNHMHIIAIDYRGFGLSSSGQPSEEGLITDGIAVVNWAMDVAGVPPERIVLLGHSLGTAVAAAVADRFVSSSPSVNFAGLVLASGFSDIPNLMKTYLVGGIIPVLSPLKPYPRLQSFISSHIIDTWDTASRLTHLTATGSRIYLSILHARNDYDIGWRHSDILFDAAVAGMEQGETLPLLEAPSAGVVQASNHKGNKIARRRVLQYGGHNKVIAHAQLALEVYEAFNAG